MNIADLAEKYGAGIKTFISGNLRSIGNPDVRAYFTEALLNAVQTENLPKTQRWDLMSARVEKLGHLNDSIVGVHLEQLANWYTIMCGFFTEAVLNYRHHHLTLDEQICIAQTLYKRALEIGVGVKGETDEVSLLKEVSGYVKPSVRAIFEFRARYDHSILFWRRQLKQEIVDALNDSKPFAVENVHLGDLVIDPSQTIVFH